MTELASSNERLVSIDLARCAALASMVIAHTAPTPGPFGVLNLSEFLTAALFAMLLGIAADLSADRMSFSALFAGSVVRAIALIALGVWSNTWGAQVDNVLPYLGVLSLAVAVLVYLPTWVLGILAALFWWFSPWAIATFQPIHAQLVSEHSPWSYLTLWMFQGGSYRVFTMLAWACAGVVLIRLMGVWGAAGDIAAALVTTTAAGALWWYISHRIEFFPYTGIRWEVGFDLLLSIAVICWCSILGRIFAGRDGVLQPFARAGRMTLSMYLLQLLILALYVYYTPRFGWPAQDDSWWMMGGLLIVLLVVPTLWHKLFGHTFLRRGPIETPLHLISGRG